MNKVVWIINQYASHLETRHYELAKSFAAQGYSVVVITSSFHHGRREYIFDEPFRIAERLSGVYYVYLHSDPAYGSNGIKRVRNMLDFCKKYRQYKKRIIDIYGKPDFIIGSSAHPFVWEIGYSTAKKVDAKFIAEFRDIWPLALIDVQGVSPNHPFVRLLGIIEKRAYKHANAIVSTMPYAWEHVISVADVEREKVYWMPNGINVSENEACLRSNMTLPRELELYLDEHWCCIYIGSIVKSENMEFLIRSFAKVKDEDIWFAVVGEGNEKDNMQILADELGLDRVCFFPHIDRELIPKALSKANVAVAAAQDSPISKYGFSKYKLNDYLLSGIPTVFSCNQRSVVDDAGHFSVPCGDETKMAEAIMEVRHLSEDELEKLRDNAKLLIQNDYDYGQIGEKYIQLLEKL